jgi:hypothetical protein
LISVIVYHTIDGSEALAHKSIGRNASSPATTTGQLIRTANGQTVVFTSVASPNQKHGVSQLLIYSIILYSILLFLIIYKNKYLFLLIFKLYKHLIFIFTHILVAL